MPSIGRGIWFKIDSIFFLSIFIAMPLNGTKRYQSVIEINNIMNFVLKRNIDVQIARSFRRFIKRILKWLVLIRKKNVKNKKKEWRNM